MANTMHPRKKSISDNLFIKNDKNHSIIKSNQMFFEPSLFQTFWYEETVDEQQPTKRKSVRKTTEVCKHGWEWKIK